MTKQDVLNKLKYFPKSFPKEALETVRANKDDYIPELLASLDYACESKDEIEDDYFLHTYAMFLLAEFREKAAFPKLISLMQIPGECVSYIIGDTITEAYDRILLSTFDKDSNHIELLQSVIENEYVYEWSRVAALNAYVFLYKEGYISKNAIIDYFRYLIYDKLEDDESYIVHTSMIGCIADARLIEMMPDALHLYDQDKVEEMMYGKYDGFVDMMFDDGKHKKERFIENTISEIGWWHCFKNDEKDNLLSNKIEPLADIGENSDDADFYDESLEEIFGFADDVRVYPEQSQSVPARKKTGRNEPCPCGSGKKYKKCCIDKTDSKTSDIDWNGKYGILDRYPKDSALFNDLYDKEARDINYLAYRALAHRAIPVWIQRDYEQERIEKVHLLKEALELFVNKCERENITSFTDYDKKYMIHYHSFEWVADLVDLIEKKDPTELRQLKKDAEEIIKKFV